ncbi:MAG: general stress protein [Candidatus Eremiobacteraeota bacterium]|nr:general stress protein [Candidatus Eremiobacteraeota bacterium]
MASTQEDYELGMYDDRSTAENAVARLHELGYSNDDISVMMNDKTKARDFAEHTGSKAATGAATGAVIGGGLGAIVAGLTATGSIAAIVGTGGVATPFVAGPLAAALAGLGAGGATGGIIGALVGAGIPHDRAKKYEDRLNNGGILVGVKPKPDNRDRLREIFPSDV